MLLFGAAVAGALVAAIPIGIAFALKRRKGAAWVVVFFAALNCIATAAAHDGPAGWRLFVEVLDRIPDSVRTGRPIAECSPSPLVDPVDHDIAMEIGGVRGSLVASLLEIIFPSHILINLLFTIPAVGLMRGPARTKREGVVPGTEEKQEWSL